MKKLLILVLVLFLFLCAGCTQNYEYDVVATTLPVYEFTSSLCQGTELHVGRLVTESVSCLHDYTLQVKQMRMIEASDVVVISGAGLEDFLNDALHSKAMIDASENAHIHGGGHDHHDDHSHDHHGHSHAYDPHIWLSPENAKIMAENICLGLSERYPAYQEVFLANLSELHKKLDALQEYGDTQLRSLKARELITFHDGFAYFAESYDLNILKAVEEESGSEASAKEIIALVELVEDHSLPAIFIEKSGSDACAGIIQQETGAAVYTLDMAMAGDSYFDAMYHNIDTIKEALG